MSRKGLKLVKNMTDKRQSRVEGHSRQGNNRNKAEMGK